MIFFYHSTNMTLLLLVALLPSSQLSPPIFWYWLSLSYSHCYRFICSWSYCVLLFWALIINITVIFLLKFSFFLSPSPSVLEKLLLLLSIWDSCSVHTTDVSAALIWIYWAICLFTYDTLHIVDFVLCVN